MNPPETAHTDSRPWLRWTLILAGIILAAAIGGTLVSQRLIPDRPRIDIAAARIGDCVAGKDVVPCSDERALYRVTAIVGIGESSKCPPLNSSALGRARSFDETANGTVCLAFLNR
ncbi:hypothetical protein ACFVUS_09070 [Nocardia sp. NPDC058058]|uniref:hypothetical protein n=1 Tax=Nocardia sp. NPDC058058 TaxID=3346317 RepID=UPI0036DE0C41